MPPEFKKAAVAHLLLRGALIVVMVSLWASGHAGAACGVLALVTVLEAFVILSSSTRVLGPVITHLPVGSDGVLITIDDGPDPQTTPAMLDLLDAHGGKAVFFLIGEKARRWPELVRQIQQRGHEIGNHTEHHPAGRFWCLGSGEIGRAHV